MKFLFNRKIAGLIAVIIVVVATVGGVNGSVSRLAGDVERLFYDGMYHQSDGYLQPSINSQIEKQADAALGLATLLQRFPGLKDASDALLSARLELLDSRGISDKCRDRLVMDRAFAALAEAARLSVEISEREIDAVEQHWNAYQGASTFIEVTLAPAYNDKVDEFYNQRSFLAALINSTAPEHYR